MTLLDPVLDFLSPDRARAVDGFAPERRSPLARALAGRGGELGLADVTLTTGKIEVRGDVGDLEGDGFEVMSVTPERALLLCEYERTASVRAEMSDRFRLVVDLTAALAGVRIERPDAERLLGRLTELDLALLPAVGAVARVPAYVFRDGEAAFRLFFRQEHGDYVVRVLVDAAEGLDRAPTTPPPDPLDRR